MVTKIGRGEYLVESSQDPEIVYSVDTEALTCTCEHYMNRNTPCRHFVAVMCCEDADRIDRDRLYKAYIKHKPQISIFEETSIGLQDG